MANVILSVKNEPADLPLALKEIDQTFADDDVSEMVKGQADDLVHQLTAYIYSIRNNAGNSKQRLYETSDHSIRELERLSRFLSDSMKYRFDENMKYIKEEIIKRERNAKQRRNIEATRRRKENLERQELGNKEMKRRRNFFLQRDENEKQAWLTRFARMFGGFRRKKSTRRRR
jgi:hypothetical protein